MKKYEIMNIINRGSFGTIFKGKNIFSNEEIAIKQEEKIGNSLLNEAKILNYLNNSKVVPKFKGYFCDDISSYLILELLEYNLSEYKTIHKNIDVSYLSIKLIEIIEIIHRKGIIHRDIKPANFLIKRENIKISDFGLAKIYINKKKHIDIKSITEIIGSPNYISINIHNLLEPSRRDDLESVIYVILFLKDKLFWKNLDISLKKKYKLDYFEKVEKNSSLYYALKYIRNLSFDEKPNYELIKTYFKMENNYFEKSE